MQPILNKVLIKPFLQKEKTLGGIVIPDTLKTFNDCGVVVSVGRGTSKRPMQFKENDIVYHIKGAGIEVEEKGEKLLIIEDINILSYKRN